MKSRISPGVVRSCMPLASAAALGDAALLDAEAVEACAETPPQPAGYNAVMTYDYSAIDDDDATWRRTVAAALEGRFYSARAIARPIL